MKATFWGTLGLALSMLVSSAPCRAESGGVAPEVAKAFKAEVGGREALDLLPKLASIQSEEARCALAVLLVNARRSSEAKLTEATNEDCRKAGEAGKLPGARPSLSEKPETVLLRRIDWRVVTVRLAADIRRLGVKQADGEEVFVYRSAPELGAQRDVALDLGPGERVLYSNVDSGEWKEFAKPPAFDGSVFVVGYQVSVDNLANGAELRVDGDAVQGEPPYLLSPGPHQWQAGDASGVVDENSPTIRLSAATVPAQRLFAFTRLDATLSFDGGAGVLGGAFVPHWKRWRAEFGAGGLLAGNAYGGLAHASAHYLFVDAFGLGAVVEPLLVSIDTETLGGDPGARDLHFGLRYGLSARYSIARDRLGFSFLAGGFWIEGEELSSLASTHFFTLGLGLDVGVL